MTGRDQDVGRKALDHFDFADDVDVELSEMLGGDPAFEDLAAARLLNVVAVEVSGFDARAGDVPGVDAGTFQSILMA
ncbi:hypothetical protein [Nocardia sp. NPDC004604]|uniref:hypothetical protein n=1 Tax=Nocardia sp. NPDC004604 TaxID=3157013 RepID=UPI0033AEAE49